MGVVLLGPVVCVASLLARVGVSGLYFCCAVGVLCYVFCQLLVHGGVVLCGLVSRGALVLGGASFGCVCVTVWASWMRFWAGLVWEGLWLFFWNKNEYDLIQKT